jgi:predicted lysophospholipase L1 biosynthesis ABC-type transport system permease subunit
MSKIKSILKVSAATLLLGAGLSASAFAENMEDSMKTESKVDMAKRGAKKAKDTTEKVIKDAAEKGKKVAKKAKDKTVKNAKNAKVIAECQAIDSKLCADNEFFVKTQTKCGAFPKAMQNCLKVHQETVKS